MLADPRYRAEGFPRRPEAMTDTTPGPTGPQLKGWCSMESTVLTEAMQVGELFAVPNPLEPIVVSDRLDSPTGAGQRTRNKRTPEEREAYTRLRMRSRVDVLADLKGSCPDAWQHATVVGRWVWVEFDSKPEPDVLAYLRGAAFHWSKRRQAWQHCCGHPCSKPSARDPRAAYGQVAVASLDDE